MFFEESFIKSLPSDPQAGLLAILDRYTALWEALKTNLARAHDLTKECRALIRVYCQLFDLPTATATTDGQGVVDLPDITGEVVEDTNLMASYVGWYRESLVRDRNKAGVDQAEQFFLLLLSPGEFCYEFSDGDLDRMQKLINELRDLVVASDELQEKHKRRVLQRLEKLQSELHKKISDLDAFYGTLIELSVVAKIVGKNAKPIVDRIRELVGIVWPTQARTFELPSSEPFQLPGQTDEKKS